jgi:hypothetical protein
MPVTDAVTYVHGSGASAFGPATSTATTFTGYISGTTLYVGTGGTGALVPGAVLSATSITSNTVVTGITAVTAALGVGTYTVSQSQTLGSSGAQVTITASPNLVGDTIVVGVTSQESNLELDFGAPNSGAAYPCLPQFPSTNEKGYTFPPEVMGDGGVELGLHIIVTVPMYGAATLATVRFDVQTGAATGATTIIASRTLTIAQLQVAGAHYFIPVNFASVLEFLRFNMTNSAAVNGYVGNIVAWFGPKCGGEQ